MFWISVSFCDGYLLDLLTGVDDASYSTLQRNIIQVVGLYVHYFSLQTVHFASQIFALGTRSTRFLSYLWTVCIKTTYAHLALFVNT